MATCSDETPNVNLECQTIPTRLDIKQLADRLVYWQERCAQAERCIKVSPCDPDVTSEQIQEHKLWNAFVEMEAYYNKQA